MTDGQYKNAFCQKSRYIFVLFSVIFPLHKWLNGWYWCFNFWVCPISNITSPEQLCFTTVWICQIILFICLFEIAVKPYLVTMSLTNLNSFMTTTNLKYSITWLFRAHKFHLSYHPDTWFWMYAVPKYLFLSFLAYPMNKQDK